MIIEFWWNNGNDSTSVEIKNKDVSDAVDIDEIKKLLDEYRKSDEYYNIYDWCLFLEERGYTAYEIEAEESIYF